MIVCMATVPRRLEQLKKNIPSLINQSYKYDCLFLIVNQYDDDSILEKYKEIEALDKRIKVVLGDNKWRSCNKVIFPLTHFSELPFITVDDDIFYHSTALEELVKLHEKYPNTIISHEANPIRLNFQTQQIECVNGWTMKIGFEGFERYMTGACLFPANVFKNTDIFNYDKMMELTDGCHDEIWLWVNTTLKGIRSLCANNTMGFTLDGVCSGTEDGLCVENAKPERIAEYDKRINNLYGNALKEKIKEIGYEIHITPETMYGVLGVLDFIKRNTAGLCGFNFSFENFKKSQYIFIMSALKSKGLIK